MSDKYAVIGDIGGTNFRLALSGPNGVENVKEFSYGSQDTPANLITTYLADCNSPERITSGVFAVASPSKNPDSVVFTNGSWAQKPVSFEVPKIETTVLNDFAAVTYAVCYLQPEDCSYIVDRPNTVFPSTFFDKNTSTTSPKMILEPMHRFVVIGPGTGLGLSTGVIMKSGHMAVIDGEGSHGVFAPESDTEIAVMEKIRENHDIEVTNETISSGTGLPKVFNAYAEVTGKSFRVKEAADVSEFARNGTYSEKKAADWTLNLFSRTLGVCAGTALLTNGASQIFIAGGIVRKLGSLFKQSAFIDALHRNDLGANNFAQDASVMLIKHPNAGLLGAHSYFQLSQK